MFWTSLDDEDLSTITRRLTRELPPSETLDAEHYTPSWYGNGSIVRLRAGDTERHYIAAGDEDFGSRRFFPLDGTSGPLHTGNAAALIRISTFEEAEEYARFFLKFVLGPRGDAFNIVDGLHTGCTLDTGLTAVVKPLCMDASTREGPFAGRANVEYCGNLYESVLLVHADGLVEMIANLPLGTLVQRQ